MILMHLVCFVIQIKEGFESGKDLVVTVQSAMGEEQICALKDIGPK
jgi:translation initiation factor 5A